MNTYTLLLHQATIVVSDWDLPNATSIRAQIYLLAHTKNWNTPMTNITEFVPIPFETYNLHELQRQYGMDITQTLSATHECSYWHSESTTIVRFRPRLKGNVQWNHLQYIMLDLMNCARTIDSQSGEYNPIINQIDWGKIQSHTDAIVQLLEPLMQTE